MPVKSMQVVPRSQARPEQTSLWLPPSWLSASVSKPMAPALATTSYWFGATAPSVSPVSQPAALAACSDPAFGFGLVTRFYLPMITLPTQGAVTSNFALTNSDECMAVEGSFIPPPERAGSSPPLSGAFNDQLSIAP
jgi:hypothetical protein